MPTEIKGWLVDDPEFLLALKSQAEAKAMGIPNLNWKRAYLALEDAADRLHAMIMRITVKENE